EAKLVVTDALIADSLRRGKAAQREARRRLAEDAGEQAASRPPSSILARPSSEARLKCVQPTPLDHRGGAQNEGESPMAVSANRLELLQIADAVAREKAIDRNIVIAAMEDAIQKAARSRYGSETEVRAEINPKTGEMRLSRLLLVVDQVENDATQIALEEANKRNPAAQVGDCLAALGLGPHRRQSGKTGGGAEGAGSGARPPVSGVQGPHFRYRQWHRQAGRIRQRGRRSRPRRGDRASRRNVAARDVPQR